MRIAVLLSTYNGEKYLNKQLESLANQTTAASMTVYIRDDGSSDRTFEIIEQWRDKIAIVLSKEGNAGPARSFWSLLQNERIQADYYAFCDQDDIWDSDKLEVAIQQLQNGYQLTCCNCRIIDGNGVLQKASLREEVPNMCLLRMFVTGFVQGCALVFTDEFRKHLCSLKITSIPMHDLIVLMYAAAEERIHWDQIPRFSYRIHDNNVTIGKKKNFVKQIQHTWKSWKNGSKNSMADVAAEMLENNVTLSDSDREYLLRMKEYRDSFRNKLWLMRYPGFQELSPKVLLHYKIRIMLGML